MMSQNKLSPTIAKSLAEKIKAKVESSKEYKAFIKLHKDMEALDKKMDDLKRKITEKYSSELCDVSIPSYTKTPEIYVRDTVHLSVEAVKNVLLIDDYLIDTTMTSDEFVNLIVEKLIK